jgi:hypothetical protein
MKIATTQYFPLILFNILFLALLNNHGFAQDFTYPFPCKARMQPPFVSDGQVHLLELKKNDKGEIKTTFYGGNTYRIIACGIPGNGEVNFILFDSEKNILFNNKNFDYTQYWDFEFKSTVECIIEVRYTGQKKPKTLVKVLLGFKN